MTAIDRVIATARAEVGYLEKASNSQLDDKTANVGKNNWTKYARDLDGMGNIYNGRKNGFDWCDCFLDWVFITTFGTELGMKLLCQMYNGLGAGVRWSANYYKNKGQYHTSNPQPGDQIFFGDGKTMWHTGLVVKVENNRVYTIEGNTTSAPGVIANGGCVAEKSYLLTYKNIDGYGRPDWSLVGEDDEDMTLERFTELMDEYRKELQSQAGSAWSAEARDWAVKTGLIQGDESGSCMWPDFLQREAFITVLYRYAKMTGQL